MKAQFTIVLVLLCVLAIPVPAQEVEFNYEGRVTVDGMPYTGPGYFKFAIVNGDGSITYWSNDGTSTAGSEPAAAVVTDVTDSVFNVIIGDASQANMQPLEASIFNGYEQVFLRVWFSDASIGFEHLPPDRRITNPALLGLLSFDEIHLYVNPDTGDDAYSGLSPGHPKRTIQAAWNTLPPMIRRDATIHLADGIYREEVFLKGKTVIGDATIAIVGNETAPDSVRVTGADAEAETTPVRDNGFRIQDQRNLSIRGLRIDYCYVNGILAERDSVVTLKHCNVLHNYNGLTFNSAELIGDNIEVGDGLPTITSNPTGIRLFANALFTLSDSYVHDCYLGVDLTSGSVGKSVSGCTFDSCDGRGFNANGLGACSFRDPTNTISNCSVGIVVAHNSWVQGTPINFINNGTDSITNTGGQSPY